MNSKHIALIAKLAISGVLIWFASTRINLSSALAQIGAMSLGWGLLIILLFYTQLAISALRYREFLRILDTPLQYLRCVDATLIGYFFSQTFISFVGGDAMRTYRVSQHGVPLKLSAKAVILDRISGLVGQVVMLVLTMPFLLPRLKDRTMQAGVIVTVASSIAGLCCIALLSRLPEAVRRFRLFDILADLSRRVLVRIATVRGAFAFFVLSLVINLMNCLIFYSIARGIGVEVSLVDLVVLLPPVFFLSMLPISVSGWGVREGATVVALGIAGVASADSLSISICFGLALVAISLPGGLLWLASHKKPAPEDAKLQSS
jgi:uncharacterized membrane protein YbhN (UPF0104 family)